MHSSPSETLNLVFVHRHRLDSMNLLLYDYVMHLVKRFVLCDKQSAWAGFKSSCYRMCGEDGHDFTGWRSDVQGHRGSAVCGPKYGEEDRLWWLFKRWDSYLFNNCVHSALGSITEWFLTCDVQVLTIRPAMCWWLWSRSVWRSQTVCLKAEIRRTLEQETRFSVSPSFLNFI